MNSPEQQQRASRPRPNPRNVQVSRVERLAEHMVRVTVKGEALAGYTPNGPAAHIKVIFPKPGELRPVMPAWGPEGPQPGAERPIVRTYTPRRWDAEAQELDIDFFLHGEGPASTWASAAKPGDEIAIIGPGGPYRVEEAGHYIVGGDGSALSAIGTILEALPASARVDVIAEVDSAADQINLIGPSGLKVTWLHRDGDSALPGTKLEEAIRALEMPQGGLRVWVGCEAGIMRSIRKHLLFERGLEREAIHTHGYWKAGEADHPDHDVGQEI